MSQLELLAADTMLKVNLAKDAELFTDTYTRKWTKY